MRGMSSLVRSSAKANSNSDNLGDWTPTLKMEATLMISKSISSEPKPSAVKNDSMWPGRA